MSKWFAAEGVRRLVVGVMLVAGSTAGTVLARQDAPVKAEQPAKPSPADYVRAVEEDGGNHVRLDVGIRTFRPAAGRTGPEVSLVGAVHIADQKFYDEVQRFLDSQDVVLFEAVKPSGAKASGEGAPQDDAAKVAATKRRIRLVAMFVQRYKTKHGAYPATVEDLRTGLSARYGQLVDSADKDAWGRVLVYTVLPPAPKAPASGDGSAPAPKKSRGFDIVSYGADGQPGGEGVDADLRFADQKALRKAEVGEQEGLQQQMADAFGLVFQLQGVNYDRPKWRNSDMTIDQVQERLEKAGADGGSLFSMLDGSSVFGQLASMALKLVSILPSGQVTMKLMMVDMLSHADEMMAKMAEQAADGKAPPGMAGMGKMMDVLIKDRNGVVLDDLKAVIEHEPEVKTVGIFYGAGHLGDMEERLRNDFGYEPSGTRWVPAIDVDLRAAGMTAEQGRQMRAMFKNAIEAQLGKGK
jgi:hypothetical protein